MATAKSKPRKPNPPISKSKRVQRPSIAELRVALAAFTAENADLRYQIAARDAAEAAAKEQKPLKIAAYEARVPYETARTLHKKGLIDSIKIGGRISASVGSLVRYGLRFGSK